MFYVWDQNNSGGSFDHVEGKIGYYVAVEAESEPEAFEKFERLGGYIDDYYSQDCPCCGSRWSYPEVLDLSDALKRVKAPHWWGVPSYIHFADGTTLKIEDKKNA